MARATPLYDGRFWRLFAGTVTLSAALTCLAAGPVIVGSGSNLENVAETLRLIVTGVSVTGISAIIPAMFIWALLWKGPAWLRLREQSRAGLACIVTAASLPLLLGAVARSVGRPLQDYADAALVCATFGLPAALIIGPALAAWIYKDAP